MKKIYIIITMLVLASCAQVDGQKTSDTAVKDDPKCKFKAVNDRELGKVFYSPQHRLYKYVSNIDRRFCTESEARSAGFRTAPDRFANSTYDYVNCLEREGNGGSCHNYALGIYQSLKIYDKICGATAEPAANIGQAVIDYANKNEARMDEGKYSSIVAALASKYSCGKRK